MSNHEIDETEMDTQDLETSDQETQQQQETVNAESQVEQVDTTSKEKSKKKKDPVELAREPGKSLLPLSRVQKIIKADEEIQIVFKEATFLISLAAEEFIKLFTQAGQEVAQREKRSTVQHRDMVTVTKKADEFRFLEEIMHLSSPEAPAKRPKSKPKGTATEVEPVKGPKQTLLHQFVKGNDDGDSGDGRDVIMNEDGTMYAAGGSEHDSE